MRFKIERQSIIIVSIRTQTADQRKERNKKHNNYLSVWREYGGPPESITAAEFRHSRLSQMFFARWFPDEYLEKLLNKWQTADQNIPQYIFFESGAVRIRLSSLKMLSDDFFSVCFPSSGPCFVTAKAAWTHSSVSLRCEFQTKSSHLPLHDSLSGNLSATAQHMAELRHRTTVIWMKTRILIIS